MERSTLDQALASRAELQEDLDVSGANSPPVIV